MQIDGGVGITYENEIENKAIYAVLCSWVRAVLQFGRVGSVK